MKLFLVIALILVGGATVDGAVNVQVTTVDDRVVSGAIATWSRQGLEIVQESTANRPLPLNEVLRVDLSHPPTAPQIPSNEVVLVDGARFATHQFTSTNRSALLQGAVAATGDLRVLEAPLDAVRSVRLMDVPAEVPSIATEWRDLLAMESTGDLIVIRRPGSPNLNFVEGTLGEVNADAVQFTLEGQTLEVKRAKVFGLIYYRGENTDDMPSPIAIVSGSAVRLPAQEISLEGESLVVLNPYLGVVRLPLTAVESVDYSIDRIQYLSHLEPTRLDWTPAPGTASTQPLFASIARDRAFYAPELSLEYPADSLTEEQIGSSGLPRRVIFAKGLAIRSRTLVAYRIPRGFPQFRATVGIDPMTQATGAVELVVLGDDEPLFRQMIAGGDSPVEVECAVAGLRELTLVVGFGPDGPFAGSVGDNLHLGGARFTK